MRSCSELLADVRHRAEATSWQRQVLLLVSIAVVVRVAVFELCVSGRESRTLESDSTDYLTLSRHLGASYLRADATYKELSVERPPIYPIFLAAANHIWAGLTSVVALQIVVGVAVVCVSAVFARGLGNSFAGLVAGLVVALDPLSILYANQVLTETVFTLALLVSAFALWRSLGGDWRWAVFAGLAFAAATLTRPVALYLFPIAALIALAATRRRVLVCLALVASFLVPTGAWIVRNKVVSDYAGVSTIEEANLLVYRAAGAISHDTGEPLDLVQARLAQEVERRVGRSPTIAARAAAERRLALTAIEHHPVGTAYITARGTAAILFGTGRSVERLVVGDRHRSLDRAITLGLLAQVLVLLIGACAGVVVLMREHRWRDLAIVALLPAVLVVISAGPEAYSRFRVPVVPFLAILFGIALSRGGAVVGNAAPDCPR